MTKKATRLCWKLVDVELSKRLFVCLVEIAIKLRRDLTDTFIVFLSKIYRWNGKRSWLFVVGLVGYCNARHSACSCIAVLAVLQFDDATCR